MILFLHIPKTAGMSLRHVITANVPNSLVVDEYSQVAFLTDQQINSFDAILGHVGAALARRLHNPQTIIFLRNPVDRLASMYTFWRHHVKSAYTRFYSQLPFQEWVKAGVFEVRMEREGAMMWQIAVDRSSTLRAQHHDTPIEEIYDTACMHIQNAAFIGFQESFDTDIPALCNQFRWPQCNVPSINRSKHQNEISPSERTEVEEILQWDMKLYRFALNEYQKRNAIGSRPSPQLAQH